MAAIVLQPARADETTAEILLAPQSKIKVSSPVQNIIWSNDSSLFAFSEGSNLIIADGSTNAISEIIHTDGTIRQVQIARSQSNEEEQLLILSGSGSVMMHALRKGAKSVYQNHANGQISSIAFSDSGKYLAMGLNSGIIQVGWKLQFSGELATKNVSGHKTGAYTLSFSPDSRYLASGADDGYVRVTRLEDVKLVARDTFANYIQAPVLFSSDGKSIFYAKDLHTLVRTGVTGATWMTENKTYLIEDMLQNYVVLEGKLAVLTADQQFLFYGEESQELQGFIPRLSKSTITDFAFSTDGTELLLGYADGSIIRVSVADYMRDPGTEVEVRFENYYSNGGTGGTGPGIFAHDENGLVPFGYILPPESFFDYLDLSAAISKFGLFQHKWDMPYSLGITVSASVTHTVDNLPLYLGTAIKASLAIPETDYPYSYHDSNGDILSAPFLLTATMPFHLGYQTKVAPAMFLFFQMYAGPSGNLLWRPGIANSGIHFSATAGGTAGFQFNGIRLILEGQYDTTTRVTFNVGLQFRLSLHERVNP